MAKRLWTRDEMILTLALYFQLPFGRLNHTSPEVRDLASLLNRTNNAVALRLVNFAACDPYIINSGRSGMSGGLNICLPYWNEYANDKEALFLEAESIRNRMMNRTFEQSLKIDSSQMLGLDKMAFVKQRVNQNAFRTMILNNYNFHCAITGISIPELLIASHIIPWAMNKKERLNPENGICLSSLYDKAFDKGFISIDKNNKIILADKLKVYKGADFYATHFACVENQPIRLPEEHMPDPQFLEWHRDCIFNKNTTT
ncbi:MAG: HNH endonuclease [Paludibacteraceae bacterium]|nr:HNH endonuclease [Paludibacteraceae bacterium]